MMIVILVIHMLFGWFFIWVARLVILFIRSMQFYPRLTLVGCYGMFPVPMAFASLSAS